jgi:hypothetical protein
MSSRITRLPELRWLTESRICGHETGLVNVCLTYYGQSQNERVAGALAGPQSAARPAATLAVVDAACVVLPLLSGQSSAAERSFLIRMYLKYYYNVYIGTTIKSQRNLVCNTSLTFFVRHFPSSPG